MPKQEQNKNQEQNQDQEQNQEQNENSTSNNGKKKKAVGTAEKLGKAAGTALGGPVAGKLGGMAAKALAKSKLGQKMINNGANLINKMPGMASKKAKEDDNKKGLNKDKIDAAKQKNTPNDKTDKESKTNSENSKEGQNKQNKKSPFPSPFGMFKKGENGKSDFDNFLSNKIKSLFKVNGRMLIGKIAIIIIPIVLILLVVTTTAVFASAILRPFGPMLSIGTMEGEEAITDSYQYETGYQDEQDYYDRLAKKSEEYEKDDKKLNMELITATQVIMSDNDDEWTFDDMTDSKIDKLAKIFENTSTSKKTSTTTTTTTSTSTSNTTSTTNTSDKIKLDTTSDGSFYRIVGTGRSLPSTFEPSGLREVNVDGTSENQMVDIAATAFETMVAAAANDGITLTGNSGYRSYATQEATPGALNPNDNSVASPGNSEHQLGTTMDIGDASHNIYYAGTDTDAWLKAHASEYGFLQRYPGTNGSLDEEWHYRFLGTELATAIKNSGLTYDEYAATYPDTMVDSVPSYSGTSTGGTSTESADVTALKSFLKDNLKNVEDKNLDNMVDEIFQYRSDYYELIGKKIDETNTCAASGSCTYEIAGFNINGSINSNQMTITNLKVRLMQCSDLGNGTPVSGEELVDFENYILGVVYGEVGTSFSKAAAQSEAIAARSYALSRPTSMGNSAGTKLVQEDGQWILQLRACTEDQVYCNPDKGCSTDGSSANTYFSGTDHSFQYMGPLAADSPLRNYVSETAGKVVVDSSGNIINTGYLSSDQNSWETMASNGLDYTQILIQHYSNKGASDIKSMSCNSGGSTSSSCNPTPTGDYASWKQGDDRWADIPVGGGGSLGKIGCLVTSVAMILAKSGAPTTIQGEFNPGTFAQALNASGGIDGDGNYSWSGVTTIAPTFVYQAEVDVSEMTDAEKASTAQDLISQGNYIVAQVTGYVSGQHWVAIDKVENGRIIMMDPATEQTDMLSYYPEGMVTTFKYYKVVG